MPEWTFITKHAVALSLIANRPRITALELSATMGITERAVRKLIADLFSAGYIRKKREGRGIRYRINPDLPLRHDTHGDIAVGDLLKSLGWNQPHGKEDKNSEGENRSKENQ
jgi:DNA-binding transcriptional ArsR family regulator